ncbi:hypothetical protein BX600DRAFT_504799 [Xylariales sp. PMI_506]|nr:hypothetical protein BX600DRAFT_504799 [Xylariales sp. PMI_506]
MVSQLLIRGEGSRDARSALSTRRDEIIALGQMYLLGTREARYHWAENRHHQIEAHSVSLFANLRYLIKIWYQINPGYNLQALAKPQDEPEAKGDPIAGTIIQECRRVYRRELNSYDVAFLRDMDWTLGEYIKYLEPVEASGMKLDIKIDTDGNLRSESLTSYTMGGSPNLYAYDVLGQSIIATLTSFSDHISSDLEEFDTVPTATAMVRQTRSGPETSTELRMPPLAAEYWQKEAILVLRMLVARIDSRLSRISQPTAQALRVDADLTGRNGALCSRTLLNNPSILHD